nr:immunoglobulin light chain junction region [Mus musculus]NSL97001.1 immunoglobulin light chain junction region [Mus musculus]NSL97034.1 immunoglobulin light chain junction region [Mus musculus]NSL97040.1 immunoglobulin light chain junction region [Mus musculus]NSL97061.1 immunoglobulin light chain junction region [Mus musculus]
CLQSDNLPLTF